MPLFLTRVCGHYRAMSWATRREYLVVSMLAAGSELGIRLLPLPRVARLFRVRFVDGAGAEAIEAITELPPWATTRLRVVRTVMSRWPVDGTCLRHSLVAGQRIRALQPQLRLGVSRGGAGVVAHAWLEVDGRSLDASSDRYLPLLPPA